MNYLSVVRAYSKSVYIGLVVLLAVCSVLMFVPSLEGLGRWVTPPTCLLLGLAYALVFRPAYPVFNKKMSKLLLSYAIIALGFGMNVQEAVASGREGMLFTVASVLGTMLVGLWLANRVFGIKQGLAYLISAGTAICGGSAIAAIAPIVRSREEDTSIALGGIFLLNAVGLFVFPYLGHWLGLTEEQFGLWSAIAIHDTSSVVGAAAVYGDEALRIATMVKLTRALWIVPLALGTSLFLRRRGQGIAIPWFILGFVGAMLANTYLLEGKPEVGMMISRVARQILAVTMFFIGAALSLDALRTAGTKSLMFAISLWVVISLGSLIYILF